MIGVQRRLTEAQLLKGYADAGMHDPRAEPCACGGVIEAENGHPLVITKAVREHQQTVQHARWWAREEGKRG